MDVYIYIYNLASNVWIHNILSGNKNEEDILMPAKVM